MLQEILARIRGRGWSTDEVLTRFDHGVPVAYLELAARAVELDSTGTTVEGIRFGGYLRVTERKDGVARSLEVHPSLGGGLRHAYARDGRPLPFTDDGRAWLADILRRHGPRTARRGCGAPLEKA